MTDVIPDVDPIGDPVGDMARAIELAEANYPFRRFGETVEDYAEGFARVGQILRGNSWASLMRERSFMAVEAAGGRRPLVGEERAAHWRRVLTP